MRNVATLTLIAFMALTPAAATAKNTTPKGGGHTPVTICHHAGPTKTITITVDDDAVAQHIAQHGDTIGPCPVTQPPVDNPPPTDTTPVPTPTTPSETPATPGTPETPAACQGGAPVIIKYADGEVIRSQPGCGEPVYVIVDRPKKEPEQLVAPERAHGHKAKPVTHAQRVARVRREQKALVQRVAQARAEQQLPHTGFPAGLIALLGATSLGGGLALRRKLLTD